MQDKKTLIISDIPFRNDTNLGKTLSTLFSDFSSDNLMQIYFSPQTPNVKFCASYYQINEKQFLHSLFGLIESRCGRIINKSDISDVYSKAEANPSAILALRQYTIIPILRDFLWSVSRWKTKKLESWLTENKPSCIFCILPSSVKSCRIIDYVVQCLKCPIVLFVTDDYYNDPVIHPGFLRRRYYRRLQKSIDKMASQVKYVVGCSELAAEEFGKKYGVPYEAVFTPSSKEYISMKIHPQTKQFPVVFRYFGNLGLERWKPLEKLGKAIANYNQDRQIAILEVYSTLVYPDAIAKLNIPNGCVFKGWVYGEEYLNLLETADIAVHVESFSEEMCRRTRLSISTKIADYLGAGKCIMAIGQAELASIRHLNKVAFMINDLSELEEKLKNLIENPELRMQLSERAKQLAVNSHDNSKIAKRIKSIIYSV